MSVKPLTIDTPCVGICSTVYGDEICRGCKRTYDEVIDWNRFTPEQKSAVYDRLNEHAEHIVSQFFTIVAPEKLASALDDQSIRYRPDHSPATWVLQWLRFTRFDKSWDELGVTVMPEYQSYTRRALFTVLDDLLLTTSKQASR